MQKEKKFKSRAFQRFEGRVDHLKQHTQFMECVLNVAKNHLNENAPNIAEGLGSSLDKHPRLMAPCEKQDIQRTFRTSITKLHEHSIVEMYKYFSAYLQDAISEFLNVEPKKFVGSMSGSLQTYKVIDIVSVGDYDSLMTRIANDCYRNLESARSTPQLLGKIINMFGLNNEIDKKSRDEVLKYLNLRHQIIHSDGCADDMFLQKKPHDVRVKSQNKKKKIVFDRDLSIKNQDIISRFVQNMDKLLLSKNYILKHVNNDT